MTDNTTTTEQTKNQERYHGEESILIEASDSFRKILGLLNGYNIIDDNVEPFDAIDFLTPYVKKQLDYFNKQKEAYYNLP